MNFGKVKQSEEILRNDKSKLYIRIKMFFPKQQKLFGTWQSSRLTISFQKAPKRGERTVNILKINKIPYKIEI